MYLLKLGIGSTVFIDGRPYRMVDAGTDGDGAFTGTFVSGEEKIELATPNGGGIAIEDSILNFISLITTSTPRPRRFYDWK
jgi:hypothetical protein